jgi:signal transduction histidine kinase
MRLSTRLLLLALACILPTVALQLGLTWRQWTERKAQLDAIATQQAQLLAGNVGSIADGARILLGAAAEFRQVRVRGPDCSSRLTALVDSAPGFVFVAMLDGDSVVRCASLPGLIGHQGDPAWLQQALSARSFTAGRYSRSLAHPGGFLPFYLPVQPGPETVGGTLVAALDLAWLSEHLAGSKRSGTAFASNSVLTIADGDGVIVARDIRHAEFVGTRFPRPALSLLAADRPGTLRLRSIDGMDRLIGYVPPTPANHRLAAVVGFDEVELMADLARALRHGAVLLAVVSALALGVTLLMARRFIAWPTAMLLAAARRWREGDLSARADGGGGGEFRQLADAFNDMAATLERREEELRSHAQALEGRVLARTRLLLSANERLRAEIAERRQAEAALLQAQKVQAVGQLAGGIAHDFNNVLQAVMGGIALMRRRAGDPAAVQRLAAMVEDAARRGESVTRRLLAFSRREELRADRLDVPELLHGLREVLAATLGAPIRVEVACEADLPPILADRGQFETVLVNLATNARDAMPKGGTLTLSARLEAVEEDAARGLPPGRYARITVADTGCGMDEETLARASEPFFTTKPLGQGTGLGLAMARSFAQGSGGTLAIRSAPGEGTAVCLWLPVAPEAEVTATVASPPQVALSGHPRVLLVDDEPIVRELLAAEIEEAGFDVAQAESGEAALHMLGAGERFDMLVTDLAMPGMDGVALIREAQRRQPGLPAILVTGFAGDAATLAVGSALSGRFLLVRKPVTGVELAERIAAQLARGRPLLVNS